MEVETKTMYLNTIKSVLSKKNWEIFKKKYYNDEEMIVNALKVFHLLGRDKEKFNKWFEMFENSEFSRLVDEAIKKHREIIEELKKIKIHYWVEKLKGVS